ncbi:MAG: sulfurtransferase [Dehalococcoidia bacterium]|nr:MAG: sulfurtransferase [Dehalococcoidia bacterium]
MREAYSRAVRGGQATPVGGSEAVMYQGKDLLVSTEWLAGRLEQPGLVLVDAGEPLAYQRAHIPGASGVPHPYLKGRENPLLVMPPVDFEALARSWGVSNSTSVIVYDDNASLHAARVWWVFRRYGHHDVRVLDGGFNAWLHEGRPVTSAPPHPQTGTFTARPDTSCSISVEELRDAVAKGEAPAIWDTRSDEEWTGTNSRGNRRTGHVPGAHHLEWRRLMQGPPSRRFRPIEEIRAEIRAAGLDPDAETVTYCQAGIRGAFGQFILTLLGNDRARNYDGSMGEWANRDDTPLVLP